MCDVNAASPADSPRLTQREQVVTRINDHYYVCGVCGQAGSERWAVLHQYPTQRNIERITP